MVSKFLQSLIDRKKKKTRRNKLPKVPRPKGTKTQERRYFTKLYQMVELLKDLTKNALIPALSDIANEASSLRPDSADCRFDGYIDSIKLKLRHISNSFYTAYNEKTMKGIAIDTAHDVNEQNSQDLDKIFFSVFGISRPSQEMWLEQEVEAFVAENATLIQSIPEEYFRKIEGIVTQGVRSGRLTNEIAKDIHRQVGVTERRARFIARDQVAKFNSSLTQLRQKDAGIEKYIWSTSGDERVRPEHEANNGQTFSWNNPPSTGHPGEDFLCRCVAVPVFEG